MQSDNSTSSGINKKTTVIYTKNQNQFTKNNKLTCTNVTMLPKNTKIVPTPTAKKSLQNKNNSAIVGRLITHKVPGSFVAAQQQPPQSIGNLSQGSSKMQVTSDTTATTTTTTTQAVNKQPTTSSTIVQASIAQPKIITASTVKAITTVSNVHKIPSKTLASNNVQTTTTATTTTPVNSQTITFKDGKLQLGQNSNVIQSVSQLTSANLQNIKSTASKDITTTNQKQIDAIQMVGGNSSNNNKVQLPASSIITQKQIIIPQKTLTTLQANQQVINKNNIQTTSATSVVQKIPMKNQRIINTSKVIDNQQQPTTKIIVKNSDTSGQQVDKCNSNNTDLLNIKKDNKNTVLISTNQQGTPQVTFQQLNNPQLVQIHGNKTLTALSVNQKVQGNIKNPLQQQQQPFVLKINTSKNTNDNIQINVKSVAQKPTTTTTTSLTKNQQAEVIQQLQGVYNQNIQIVDVANQPPVVNSSPSKKRTKQIIRKDTGKVNSVTKRTTDGNIVDTVNDDNDDNDNDEDDKKLINNSVTKQQVWITKNNNQTVENLQSNDSIVKQQQQKQQQVIRKTLGDISSSDDCSSNKNLLDPSNVSSVVVNANKKTTDTNEHSSLSSQQQQDTTVYSGQQRSTPIKTHSNMSSFDTLISAAFNESAQSLDQIDYQSNDSQCKDYKKQNINKLTQDNNKFSYPGKKPTRIKTSLNTDMNCLKLSIDNSTDKLKSNDQLSNNIIPRERYQIQPSGQKITFLSSLPQQDNTLRISKKITGIKTSLNTDMNPLKTLAVAASVASNEHMIKTNVKNLIQQNKNPSNILQKNQNIKIQSQNNSPQQSQFLNTQQSSQLQNKNKPFVHVTLSPETRRNIERKLNIIPDKKDIIFNENNDVKREINFADTNRKALLPHECLQFVLQDHNYGAPRPKTPISTSPVKQQQQHHHQQQQQPINGATSSTFSHQTFNYNPGVVKSNGAKIEDDAASAISSDAGRDVEPEGEETDTAPEGEGDGDDEDSVTRCICGFEHDDGYMISCDRCLTWQHVDCMGIDRSNIPEKYLCEQCEPRRIDHQRARTLQLRKREELMNSDSTSDTASTSSADTDHGTNITPVNSTNVKKRSGPQQQNVSRRKSDPVQHRRLNNNNNNNSNNNLNNINENNSVVVNNNYSNTLNKNSRQNNNNTTTRKKDMTTISATSPAAPISAAASLPASTVSATTTTTPKRSGGSSNSGAQGKRRNKRRSSVNCDEDNQDSWGSSMTPLRKWIEQYEDAVTNHYSPELRARVSSIKINSGYNNEFKTIINNNNTNTMTNNKCRVSEHNNSSNILVFKYLLATIYLPPNTLVLELRGKYMLSTQYKPPHQGRQIAQRPGPFVFFYRLPRDGPEICVDTRTYGNDARFIRRSCTPNAEIKHCLEKGTIHLYIVTTQTIDKNEEITIRHEQHDMILSNNTNANSLLQFACACGNPRTCKVASSNQVGNNSRQVNNTTSTITATTTTSSTAASATTTTNGNSIENPTDGRERRRRGRRSTVSEDNNDSTSAGPSNISNIQSNNQTVTQKLSTENSVESSAVTIAKKLRDELRRKTKDNSKIESQITTEQSEVSSVKNSTSEKSVIIPVEEPSSKIIPIPPTTTTTMTTIITTTTTTVSRQPSPITTLATAAAVVAEIETAMTTTAAVSPVISPTVSSKLSSETTAPTVKSTQAKNKNETKQKLTREDRKFQAIIQSIAQMEKAEERKKVVKARNKQRKESGGNSDNNDKIIYGQNRIGSSMKNYQNKKQHNNIERPIRRKRRKGRSRTTSTSSQKQSNSRLSRLSSADSDLSSNDDNNISIQSSFVRRRQQSQLQTNVLPLSSLSSSSSTTPSAAAASTTTTSSSSYNDNIYSSSNINNCNDNNNSSSIPTAAGLLLALASGGNVNNNNNINDNLSACQLPPPPPPLCKSPTCDSGASSSSSQSSTPSTPLSSACLLVAAAVGPLAPGFKFPKTKKVLMNEWLRKSPEPQQQQQQQQINSHNTIVTASMLSPNNFNYNIDNNKTNDYINQQQNYAAKSLATLVQAANSVSGICDSSSSSSPQRKQTNAPLLNTIQGQLSSGSAKKRWLRQAISEECESPNSRPESPPCEIVAAPPKKRRIARESMSSDNYTPPTTPTHLIPDNNYIINNNIHNNNNNNNNNDQTIYSTIDNDYSDRLPVQQSTSSTTVSYVTTSYPDHETEDKDLEMKKLEFYRNFDLINCNNVNNVVRKIEPIVEVKNETKDLIAKIEIDNDDYNNNDDGGEDDKKIIEINIKNDDVIAVEPIKMETIIEMDSIKKEEITMEDSSVSSNIKIEKTEQQDDQIMSNEIDEYNCSTPTITSSEINNSNDEKNNTNDLLSITNNDQMSIDEFDVEAQMKKITGDDSNDFICTKEKIDISLEKSKESFDGIEGLMESPKEDSGSDDKDEDEEEKYNNNIEEDDDEEEEEEKEIEKINNINEEKNNDIEDENLLKLTNKNDEKKEEEERAFKEIEKMSFTLNNDDDDNTTTTPTTTDFINENNKTEQLNVNVTTTGAATTSTACSISEESMFDSISNLDCESVTDPPPEIFQSIPPLSERIRKKKTTNTPKKKLDFEASIIESTLDIDSSEITENGELNNTELSAALRQLLESKIDEETPPPPTTNMIVDETEILSVNKPPPDDDYNVTINEIQQQISSTSSNVQSSLPPPPPSSIQSTPSTPLTSLQSTNNEIKRLKDPRRAVPHERPACETPAPIKRKLSITEYRKRKQQSSNTTSEAEPSNENSPEKSPNRGRSDSASSGTSSLSSDDENTIKTISSSTTTTTAATTSLTNVNNISDVILNLPLFSTTENEDKKGGEDGKIGWSSAPTLVERQRENLTERLKREFGLFLSDDEEERARKQGLTAEAILKARLSGTTADLSLLKNHTINFTSTQLPPQVYIPPPGTATLNYSHLNDEENYQNFTILTQQQLSSASSTQVQMNDCHSTELQSTEFLVPEAPPGSNPYPPQFSTTITSTPLDPPPFDNNLGTIQSQSSYYNHP